MATEVVMAAGYIIGKSVPTGRKRRLFVDAMPSEFATLADATEAASNLAQRNPGVDYYVFQPIRLVRTKQPPPPPVDVIHYVVDPEKD
jgi:hypothetical protein